MRGYSGDMEPWDDRGQSIQIGAVLIFAALILLLSLYQATIVPQQNEQVEFDHSRQVQGDLLDLRNAVTSMFGESASRSVSIQLGTTYPSRVLAVNPPPASGSLRTAGTADGSVSFELSNVEAMDEETDDFWGGSVDPYSTGAMVYRPNYNEYGQPPRTVYDSTVLYDNFTFEGSTIARSDQTLVDGSTISLVALNGSIQRSSSGTAAVDVRPVSASSTTVTVTNRDAGPIEIRTATRLPEQRWEELLADQRASEGGNVSDGDDAVRTVPLDAPGYRTLVVELVPGTYELRMAKAGVGTRVTDTSAAYMTDVAADGSTVPEDGSVRLTVEARDAYNNPVAGVDVTGESTDTAVGTVETNEVTTGDDGRASFQFEAKSVDAATDVPVEFNFTLDPTTPASFDARDPEDVETVVEVQNTQVSGGSGGGGAGYSLEWTDAATVPSPTASAETCPSAPNPCNVTMQSETSEPQIGAPVGFGSNDTSLVRVFRRATATGSDGTAETTVRFERAEGNATLWTQSAGVNATRTVSTPSYESFESGFGKYGVFGTFQGDDPELSTQNANSGSSAVVLRGGDDGGIVTTEYDTTGAEMVVVQYWAQDSGAEANDADTGENEDLVVEYRDAGGNWVEIDRLQALGSANSGQNPTYHRVARIGADAVHGNFSLRFRQVEADSANDEWLIDDPQISVIGEAVGGGTAGGRTPGSGPGGPSGSLAYAGDAEAVDGPDGDATAGGVEFSLANQFGDAVEVQSVTVDYPGANARLNDGVTPNDEPQRTEIYVAGETSDGWVDINGGVDLPNTFDMDADGFDNAGNPETAGGSSFSVYLYEFVDDEGDTLDMSGETITVDVTYSVDGGASQTESYTITVGGGGGGGSDSASQMTYVSGSGGTFWENDGVTFQVTNGGSSAVTVTGVTVNSTSRSQVGQVLEGQTGWYARGQHEVFIDADTDGVLDLDGWPYYDDEGTTELPIDAYRPLTEDATVGTGSTATVDIYQFQNNGGSSVDMSGATVTVTLHFSDGSKATYQVTT